MMCQRVSLEFCLVRIANRYRRPVFAMIIACLEMMCQHALKGITCSLELGEVRPKADVRNDYSMPRNDVSTCVAGILRGAAEGRCSR